MRNDRIQNKGVRSQKSALRIFFCGMLASVFCVLPMSAFSLQPSAVTVGAWDPEAALTSFLEDNYPWNNIEVSNVRITGNVPDKSPELITVEKGPVGKGVFSFIFDNNQKAIARADVRVLDSVIKSTRPFRKGYVLQDEDIYQAEMDINKMPKGAVKDRETVLGKSLKRSVLADTVIVEDMVEKTQTLKKGARVVLLIRERGFNITASGKTKERGYVGMQIRAMNLSSKKEVRGVLIDEETVRVEL